MWKFFQKKANRELVGWVGGGLTVLAAAVWAIFMYVFPLESPPKQPVTPPVDCTVQANQSVATCGDINVPGSINITGGDNIPKATK